MQKILFLSLAWFLCVFFLGAFNTHFVEQLFFQITLCVAFFTVLCSALICLLEKK